MDPYHPRFSHKKFSSTQSTKFGNFPNFVSDWFLLRSELQHLWIITLLFIIFLSKSVFRQNLRFNILTINFLNQWLISLMTFKITLFYFNNIEFKNTNFHYWKKEQSENRRVRWVKISRQVRGVKLRGLRGWGEWNEWSKLIQEGVYEILYQSITTSCLQTL